MKTSAKNAKLSPVSMPDHQHHSVSVRKIANGYIVCESCDGPKGYQSTEKFTPTKPKIAMQVMTVAAKLKKR